MMATTLVPPTTTPKSPSGEVRFVSVRAHLLPDEVVSARQVQVLRKQVLVGLVVVVALLIGWFGVSKWQTISANSDLSKAEHRGVALQTEQNRFASLVQAQNQITTIQSQLVTLMAGDLSWKTMLTTLRAKAPSGVGIDSVDGVLTSGAGAGAAAPGSAVLNMSGQPAVGQLTVTGTAPDKRTVAAYSDSLATVKGLTAPLVSSVTAEEKGVKFTISAVITADALGGRYATPTATAGTTGGN
jgi:Tfp pilus assembly protein PilN